MVNESILTPEMMKEDVKTKIGISDDNRKGIVEILNERLCDETVLYIKTRNYHWNVTGPRFQQLHEFLEEQYTLLAEMIDEIAERVRMLGGKSLGTMHEYVRYNTLKEEPGKYPDAQSMLSNLLKDHETVIQTLRKNADEAEDFKDMGTNDFLIESMRKHEKMAWMLRAHLEGKGSI